MNRRNFTSSVIGALLVPISFRRGLAQEAPSTPDTSDFPEPEALASGLMLIDQRMVLLTCPHCVVHQL